MDELLVPLAELTLLKKTLNFEEVAENTGQYCTVLLKT